MESSGDIAMYNPLWIGHEAGLNHRIHRCMLPETAPKIMREHFRLLDGFVDSYRRVMKNISSPPNSQLPSPEEAATRPCRMSVSLSWNFPMVG